MSNCEVTVSGRNRTTRNTGNRCQHNVLAELTLRHDHSGTERRASEIGKWKPRHLNAILPQPGHSQTHRLSHQTLLIVAPFSSSP